MDAIRTVGRWALALLIGACAVFALWQLSRRNYLLFHGLVELFSIAAALAIFMLAWNARRFLDSDYLLFVGIAYLFVGLSDLVHTLSYEGMGVFPGHGSNAATQLWIGGRYLESLSLLLGPVFLSRRLRRPVLLVAGYALALILLVLSVFHSHQPVLQWLRFPDCYIEGQGLTPFKIASEYVICGILASGLALLIWQRRRLDERVLRLMAASITLTILSELAFTRYVSVFGFFNTAGHILKAISFYLIYRALIATGLTKPYSLLFRDLKRSQEALQKARDGLEERVRERTAELAMIVDQLGAEVRDRRQAEEKAEGERRRVFSLLQGLPGYVVLWGQDHRLRFANERLRRVLKDPGAPCYKVFRGRSSPCEACPARRVLDTGASAEWECPAPDGKTFHVWGYPFTESDGSRLVLQLRIEVTEQKRLEADVLRSADSERRRIGRDLHDSLGQVLGGISCLSQVLHRKLASKSLPEAQEAQKIESLIVDSIHLTRSLARGLNPIGDRPDSLMIALQDLASNLHDLFGIACRFQCEEPVLVSDSVLATHLYRIAQEAASNAMRHAKAETVRIDLASGNGEVVLSVEDDGVGLPQARKRGTGMGLRIMRYRADTIRGVLHVGRNAQGGTTVTCRVPTETGQ